MHLHLPQRSIVVATAFCVVTLLSSLSGFSQDANQKPDAKAKAKAAAAKGKGSAKPAAPPVPPIHKVKEETFEIKIELDGTFTSRKATPVSLAPKQWADLTVVEAAPHGAVVKKGDVILKLDTEKLEKAIHALEEGQALADLTLETAVAELDTLEKTTPLTLAASRRAKLEAEENLAYYEDVTLPINKRNVDEGVKSATNSVSYVEEELNQLKKMYEADDMSEETEEIILKRAQNNVDRARWSLEQTRIRADRSLSTTIPREHEAMKHALELTQVNWRATEKTTRDALTKKKLEVAQARRAHEKAAEKFAEMKGDLEILTVTAPHDGIVYYGMAVRGKWATAAAVEKKLIPGGKVAPHEIFMTVVDPNQLSIHASVPEAKLKDMKAGLEGTAAPKWNDTDEFKTRVESISYIPLSNNTFDAVFTSPKKGGDQVYPGMGAKIRIDLYKKDKALTVPKKAVKKEGKGHIVTMKDGKKRKVKTGKSNATMTEIIEGLKVGEEVKTQ